MLRIPLALLTVALISLTATRTWKISLSVWMMQDSWLHEVVWALPPGSEPCRLGRNTSGSTVDYRNPSMEGVGSHWENLGQVTTRFGLSSLTGEKSLAEFNHLFHLLSSITEHLTLLGRNYVNTGMACWKWQVEALPLQNSSHREGKGYKNNEPWTSWLLPVLLLATAFLSCCVCSASD